MRVILGNAAVTPSSRPSFDGTESKVMLTAEKEISERFDPSITTVPGKRFVN